MTLPLQLKNIIIRRKILYWYKKNKRNLPWRDTADPYHIVVSEMMLQQTQVGRVVPKYHAFLNRFPTLSALASARAADVIDVWVGLGYNRRALYLHQFAQEVVGKFGGVVPSDVDSLLSLPGIGPYTSRAILCFGFGKDVPVADINIKRIYSRLFFCGEGTEHKLLNVAREMVPHMQGVVWNNALMDFGSLVCMDKPRCDICPLREQCSAFAAGVPEKYVKPKSQSRFAGSDRYYRSLVVKELRKAEGFRLPVSSVWALKPSGKSDKWFTGILNGLERDGLLVCGDGWFSLP